MDIVCKCGYQGSEVVELLIGGKTALHNTGRNQGLWS